MYLEPKFHLNTGEMTPYKQSGESLMLLGAQFREQNNGSKTSKHQLQPGNK